MNFNHDTGNIDTILSLTTTAPPAGGTAGVLTVEGTGAIVVPVGTTAERPTGANGMVRYNTSLSTLESWNGSTWVSTQLNSELTGLSALSSNGIITRTASGTYTSRTISGTASNITVTNGDGVSGNPTINLATVTQGATGTSFVKVQLDSYGRVINNTAVVASDITGLVDSTYVNVSGDTMNSGANLTFAGGGEVLGLPTTPSAANAAASKAYVDSVAQGLDPKQSVRVATTAAGTLASSFQNGSTVDGVTLATGDRILIKNQASQSENGIYTVNASGAPTRATDMDAWSEVPNAFVFVEVGSTLADTGWVCTSNQGGTLNTTPITFVQFSGAGTYTQGTGITISGNTISLSTPVAVANGGTGLSSTPSNGQLDIGNGTGFTRSTLTQGTGITVTNGSGTITIANAGVTSLAGTTNQITASASTGSVTLSLPSAITAPGSVTVTTNLTVSGLTANTMLYSGTAGLLTSAGAATNGQLLIGSTGAAPVRAALTQGTGISITNGAGSITINNTGVTSVGLSLPAMFTVTNSPVTTTGTLTATLASQTANTIFAAPSGSAGAPTFRTLTATDLSTAIQLYKENPSTPTAPTATGTNSLALGSGSKATATGAAAIGDGTDSRVWGGKAVANGSFATAGDAQSGTYILRAITSDATANQELFLNGSGASQRLVLPNNSLFTFTILVAARRTDTTGGGAGYKIEGVIRKDTTAGSTAIVGAVSKSVLGELNTPWDVSVTADTTNGSLKIAVTGEAAKTIRWVATVITCEVTN